jgi:predicted transposase YbfD/YdcC
MVVPSVSSLLIDAVVGHLDGLAVVDRAVWQARIPRLVAALAWVPDPRDARGVRHGLVSLLAAAVAATVAGARSLTAIAEWVADPGMPADLLEALQIRFNPLARRFEIPDEATFRDVLERLNAPAFAAAVGAWLGELAEVRDAAGRVAGARPVVAGRPKRESVAVDGKALRATRHHTASGRPRHLLAAVGTRFGRVLGQLEVDGKTNELSAFKPLLAPLDLTDVVVTADALHTQREHASFLAEEKNAHFILIVKKNQRSLYHQLKALPWRKVQVGHTEDHHGHGRTERRSIKTCSLAEGLLFPHAHQAICITRKVRPRSGRRWTTVTVYAVTSLKAHHATPEQIARWIRAHWHIEALHHIRDVTYRQDHCQIRTGSGPAVMATLRILAIAILKFCGWTNIAKANRHHHQDPRRCLETLGLTTRHQDP